MSTQRVPDNKKFENKFDNADLPGDRTAKDIASAYTSLDEMTAYRQYLETLQLEAKIRASGDKVPNWVRKADGSLDEKEIEIKDLVPQPSEFEQARRRTLKKLNDYRKDAAGLQELKRLYAEFDTESDWELSSEITNFIMDSSRRDRVKGSFKFY